MAARDACALACRGLRRRARRPRRLRATALTPSALRQRPHGGTLTWRCRYLRYSQPYCMRTCGPHACNDTGMVVMLTAKQGVQWSTPSPARCHTRGCAPLSKNPRPCQEGAKRQAAAADVEAERGQRGEAEGVSEQLKADGERRSRLFRCAVDSAVQRIQAELEAERDGLAARCAAGR